MKICKSSISNMFWCWSLRWRSVSKNFLNPLRNYCQKFQSHSKRRTLSFSPLKLKKTNKYKEKSLKKCVNTLHLCKKEIFDFELLCKLQHYDMHSSDIGRFIISRRKRQSSISNYSILSLFFFIFDKNDNFK